MDYSSNPFFQNRHIETIGNNLIKAFNDDGSGAERQARRRLLDAQTEDQVGKNRGREAAATAVQGLDPSQPITAQFLQNVYSNYVRSGMDPSRASAIVLGMTANGGAPDPVVARAFVGSGHAIGKDQSFSEAGREVVAKRENDAAFGRTKYSADSSAGATIAANNARIAFERDDPTETRVKGRIANQFVQKDPEGGTSLLFTPHNVPSGGQANYAPGDPRATGPVVAGPPSKDRFVQTPGADGKPEYQPVSPGLPAMPVDKPPRIINEKAVGQIEMDALSGIGMWNVDAGAADPAFSKQYAAKMEEARIVAAETLQTTGNAGKAQQAYLATLGIKPGSDVSTPGGIARLFGAKPVEVTPPAPPAGTAQAAPSISEQFAPKPGQGPAAGPAATAAPPPPPADPAQRRPGVYSTPKGPMTWTGTGWVKTQNANDGAR